MGLIPIHLHLDKICGHQQLRMVFLPSNHMIKALLDHYHSNALNPYHLFLEKLSSKQRIKVKSSIVNANNHLNGILPLFNPLHKELMPGFQLVDTFSNFFSFNVAEYKVNNYKATYLWKVDDIFKDSLCDFKTIIIISNVSIKHNVAISIAHVCSGQNIVAKTIHHAVNVTSTEAELFAVRCRINQVIQVTDILCIIVITDAIYSMRYIFNSSSHHYQI